MLDAQPIATGDDLDVEDLPPLDGLEGEDDATRAPGGAPPEDDGLDPEDAAGGLDDATGEDDAAHPEDLEVEAGQGQWLEEPADAQDLDIGEVEIDGVEAAPSGLETDESEPEGEDRSLGVGLDSEGLDSGEEGPEGPDEELRDNDLPELGEAEDDEADGDLVHADLPSTDEPFGIGWAAKPWTRVGAPIPVGSATAVAVASAARGAFVAGVEVPHVGTSRPLAALFRVDLEGGCETRVGAGAGDDIRGVAAESDVLAVRTAGREVMVSYAGGPFERIGGAVRATDVVVAGGVVWLRSETGRLFAMKRGEAPVENPTPANVAALSEDGAGRVVVLLADGSGPGLAIARGGPGGSTDLEPTSFDPPSSFSGAPHPATMAAQGSQVAYATREGILLRRPGEAWKSYPIRGQVVALSFVDGGEGLAAVVCSEVEDTTGIVRIGPDGQPKVVALLGTTDSNIESDGLAAGIANDEARGVVWVVGDFGVAAFSTR